MRRSRRSVRKKPEKAGTPAWMVTYGDLTTQVLCFFVMLFSLSVIDPIKAMQIERGFREQSGMPPQPVPKSENAIHNIVMDYPDIGRNKGGVEVPGPSGQHLRVERVREGLRITLEDYTMFEQGSAELLDEAVAGLGWIRGELEKSMNVFEVRGYTSAEAEDSIDGDAWLLGFDRARNLGAALLGDEEVPAVEPARMRLASCGPYWPVDPDSFSERGRRRNRRAEVIITEEIWSY